MGGEERLGLAPREPGDAEHGAHGEIGRGGEEASIRLTARRAASSMRRASVGAVMSVRSVPTSCPPRTIAATVRRSGARAAAVSSTCASVSASAAAICTCAASVHSLAVSRARASGASVSSMDAAIALNRCDPPMMSSVKSACRSSKWPYRARRLSPAARAIWSIDAEGSLASIVAAARRMPARLAAASFRGRRT